jgi:K+-transporting ATPase ATPase C chain
MSSEIKPAILMTVVLTVLTGLVYPLVVTGLSGVLMPYQANGSLVVRGDAVLGSDLIAQSFAGDGYFHPRPSAAGDKGYDPTASGGTNLGPIDQRLVDRVRDAASQLHGENPARPVPVDLVTTSGSGLDPHVTPASAEFQVPRIAKARGLTEDAVREVVQRTTEGRQLGFLGEPRMNVLRANLALDALAAR